MNNKIFFIRIQINYWAWYIVNCVPILSSCLYVSDILLVPLEWSEMSVYCIGANGSGSSHASVFPRNTFAWSNKEYSVDQGIDLVSATVIPMHYVEICMDSSTIGFILATKSLTFNFNKWSMPICPIGALNKIVSISNIDQYYVSEHLMHIN